MAIAPGQQINAALARVDSSAPLQAELATGPIRTQARLEASARKIKQANEAMAEYKQKQETKKLKNQTVAYLQTLNDKKDPATQQVLQGVGVNFEDNKEVGAFIDVMGGSKSTMDTILESIQETDKLFKEAETKRKMAQGIQSVYTGGTTVADQTMPGGPQPSAKGEAVLSLIQQGNDLETIKEFLGLLDFEDPVTADPVDVGAEVIEDFKNMKIDQEAGGPYVINYQTGQIKYKGRRTQEIKPGSPEYENLRAQYPDGVAELERRRAFRSGQGAPKDTSTETPVMSEDERRKLFEKYNIPL
jgi:hypothetical protein